MIITFANNKGGTGKSTLAAHVAVGMAARGLKVGAVDADSQGHLGRVLGIGEKRNALFELLIEGADFDDVVVGIRGEQIPLPDGSDGSDSGCLYLIRSDKKTARLPEALGSEDPLVLLEKLEEFKARYLLDVIVIDTKPNTDAFDSNVYMATDGFVFVTEPEDLSIDGIDEIIGKVTRFNKRRGKYLNRESEVLGIIVNKLRANTSLHRDTSAYLGEKHGSRLWSPPITLRIGWAEAVALGMTVYESAPNGQEALDAWTMVDNVLRSIGYVPEAL